MKTTFEHKYTKGQAIYLKINNSVSEGVVDRVICTDILRSDEPNISYDVTGKDYKRNAGIPEMYIFATANEAFGIPATEVYDVTITKRS